MVDEYKYVYTVGGRNVTWRNKTDPSHRPLLRENEEAMAVAWGGQAGSWGKL
jgi:hypothetical protein